MPATGIVTYTLEDFRNSARTYRRNILRLPIVALRDDLRYMTLRPNVRYSEVVSQSDFDVEFRPYKRGKRELKDLKLIQRDLRTYFGKIDADFEPNSAINTIVGHRASLAAGKDLAHTPTAQEVLYLAAKSAGKKLKLALFSAVRDEDGETTQDLFDGFDTITANEIAQGNISEEKGNYHMLSAKPDDSNAVKLAKEMLRKMSPELRAEECFLFCSQDFADAYNEAYLESHKGLVYNTKYNQVSVEGSNQMLTIVPLLGKTGSRFIHIAPKANMLVGVDQFSDLERVKIGDYDPDLITMSMRMFFGVEFESIDPRRLLVCEIPE